MKKVLLIMGSLLFISLSAQGADINAGKAKSMSCAGCHGANGMSPSPMWPNLAGQKAKYLVKQLKDFKSGKRKNGTMQGMVAGLSVKDMENIAAYYASLKAK